MSLLLLFRPNGSAIIPGPAIPGPTISYREPVALNYREPSASAYREPAARTGT